MKMGTVSASGPEGRSTMRIVGRRRQLLIWVLLGVAFGSLSLAAADLSPACRTLAKQFADAPEALTEDALIRFHACIHTALKNRGMDKADTQPPPEPPPPSKAFVGPGGIVIPFR